MSRFLQIVLALVGLLISGVLGLASQRSEALQTKNALLGLFGDSIAVARTTCDLDMTFVAEDALARLRQLEEDRFSVTPAERVADLESIAKYQDNLDAIRSTIGSATCKGGTASTVVATTDTTSTGASAGPTAAPVQEQIMPSASASRLAIVRSNNVALRSALAQAAPATSNKFYVVLAAYAVGDDGTYGSSGAAAHYAQLQGPVASAGVPLSVYRTSISNHFAIVLGGPDGLTRDQARDLQGQARSQGWAADAFVQEEQNWTRCETVTDGGLRACAGTAINLPSRGIVARTPSRSPITRN